MVNNAKFLGVLLFLLCPLGCARAAESTPRGLPDPDAVGLAILRAAEQADIDALRKLVPTHEELDLLVTCRNRQSEAHRKIDHQLEYLDKSHFRLSVEPNRLVYAGRDLTKDSLVEIRPGERWKDCIASRPFGYLKTFFRFQDTTTGEVREWRTWLVRIERRWLILDLD